MEIIGKKEKEEKEEINLNITNVIKNLNIKKEDLEEKISKIKSKITSIKEKIIDITNM